MTLPRKKIPHKMILKKSGLEIRTIREMKLWNSFQIYILGVGGNDLFQNGVG